MTGRRFAWGAFLTLVLLSAVGWGLTAQRAQRDSKVDAVVSLIPSEVRAIGGESPAPAESPRSVPDSGLPSREVPALDVTIDVVAPKPEPGAAVSSGLLAKVRTLVEAKRHDEAWAAVAKDVLDARSTTSMGERVDAAIVAGRFAVKACDVGLEGGVSQSIDRLVPAGDAQRRGLALVFGLVARRCVEQNMPSKVEPATRAAWTLDESEPNSFLAQARLAFSENRIGDSVDWLERGLRRNPNHAELLRLLAEYLKEQQVLGGLLMMSSAHFNLLYASRDDEDAARWTLAQLDEAWEGVGRLFDLHPAGRTSAVLLDDAKFNVARHSDWASGFYDGKVKVTAGGARSQSGYYRGIVFHEYAHHLFRLSSGQNRPAWLNEGLAQRASRLGDPYGDEPCASSHLAPLKSLHAGFGTSEVPVRLAYLTADHAAHRFIETHGWPGVQKLLAEMKRTPAFPQAFERATSVPYDTYAAAFDTEASR